MDLKKRIQELCKEKNISMNQLEQELSFGKGYLSKLGKSVPNSAKIQQIADYFEVTVDYLINGKKNDEDSVSLPPNIRAAARGMMELSPEDQKTAIEMIKFLSQKGKEAKEN